MDPYIDPDRLDSANPFYAQKMHNLRRGNAAYTARAEQVNALPVKITLQTTDVCNLDCPHCQIPKLQKTTRMDEQVFRRVSEELFPTLVELHPTNLGEPLTWPLFEALCYELARFGVLLDLTTNGTLLQHKRIQWIRPIARDIKISFDGATRETFERLRRGARFDAVCDNVRQLVAELHDSPRKPTVSLQMTLMKSNYHELPALVRLGAELGVQRVKAYHLFSFSPEMDAESLMHDLSIWPPVLAAALREGQRLGIELQCAEPEQAREAPSVSRTACHLPWHETWIDLDGAVLPCHSHGGDSAGNILNSSFEAVWNGPLYRRIRRGYSAARLDWQCEGCGMNCQKAEEHQAVPYDPASFLSPAGRSTTLHPAESLIRWSSRMRPFGLEGRRNGR